MTDGVQELAKAKIELAKMRREDPTNPFLVGKEKRVKRLELNFGGQKINESLHKKPTLKTPIKKKIKTKVSLWDGIVTQHKGQKNGS